MSSNDFTITLLFDQSPEEVFNAVNNVRGWWSTQLEGDSENLGDVFTYRYRDMHWSVQKLIEVIPGKKVSWLVTDSSLNFIQHKDEWNGTTITFEISAKENKTQLKFTHVGLVPSFECFDACSGGWTYYIESLNKLITTGQGQPDQGVETSSTLLTQ